MKKFKPAFREWLVDHIKRSGEYGKTLRLLRNGYGTDAQRVTIISSSDSISRDDIFLTSPKIRRLSWGRRASSSGTSGRPLVFQQPVAALQAEQAFIDFMWFSIGYHPKARVAVMRGISGFHGASSLLNRMVISSDGWEDTDVRQKYLSFCKFRPEFIDCYPSILERFILRCHGLGMRDFPRVRGVLAGSEACYPYQEGIFRKALGAPTVSWYGQSEQVALGLKVSDDEHHFFPNYSDLAFIRHEHMYEIAGRSKLNPFFSKQWYRTGDYCKSANIGFNADLNMSVLVVKGLSGRNPEFIRTKDNVAVPFNQIVFGLHSDAWLSVTRYCFVQEKSGVVKFYYAENSGMSAETLIKKLRSRFPRNITLIPICSPKLNEVSGPKWRYFWPSKPPFVDVLRL